MRKTALAKTVDPQEALEAARMHDLVVGIIMTEFIGDLGAGVWLAAAQRAAQRVVEAVVRDWKMPHSGAPEPRAGSAPGKQFTSCRQRAHH